MNRVAILIAASPTRPFYSQVAVIARALRRLPWSRWVPRVHLYVGGPREPGALEQWRPYLDDVVFHWSSEDDFARDGDWAQSDDVFRNAPADADVLLALDADTLPVGSLEPVLDRVLDTRAVAGVTAHYPPFAAGSVPSGPSNSRLSTREAWRRLQAELLPAPLDFSFSYSLQPSDVPVEDRMAPFYLNFGVVFFPRANFDDLASTYLAVRPRAVHGLHSPDFSGQVALTLAIAARRLRTWELPMRYNFPNDPIAGQMYPLEMQQAVVWHYLRTDQLDRHRIFLSAEEYERFLSLPLRGVNRLVQGALRGVVGDVYPFS